MKATRVVVLTSVHKPFSGRIFHRQCVSLAEHGYEVTYVAPAEFKSVEKLGVTVRGVKPAGSRLARPLVWLRLFLVAIGLRPQVIHFHDPELLLLMPFLKLWLGRKTITLYDVHEYFVDSLADKYWIPKALRGLAMRLAKSLERFCIRWVDGIVCAVDGLVPLYEKAAKPVVVARNLPRESLFRDGVAVDAMRFDGFKLIYAGLILPKRGINVLLEAMRIIHQEETTDIHLVLIGHIYSDDYKVYIQRFCEEHRLTEYVRWLGVVPHEEVKNYLVGAHVGLAPGLVTRQYSNPGIATKLFEYMLCSLPIISADYPHRRVYIEEADCGIMVPPEDAAAHAKAFKYLRQHKEEAVAQGERGRAFVRAHYTWEVESKRLLAFYSDLLGAGDVGRWTKGVEGG